MPIHIYILQDAFPDGFSIFIFFSYFSMSYTLNITLTVIFESKDLFTWNYSFAYEFLRPYITAAATTPTTTMTVVPRTMFWKGYVLNHVYWLEPY